MNSTQTPTAPGLRERQQQQHGHPRRPAAEQQRHATERSERMPAGSAISILARLAAAHTSGTQVTAIPACVAHSTTKTSGTLASASSPAATMMARRRPCSARQ